MGTLQDLITDFLSLFLFIRQIFTFKLYSRSINLRSEGLDNTIISALFVNRAIYTRNIHFKVYNYFKYLSFLESFAWI